MLFTRKTIADALNVPSKCSGCGEPVTGKTFCEQCASFYEMGLEKLYLDSCPHEREHVHEVGYNDRMNNWAAYWSARGALPTPAQIIAKQQDVVVDVLKSGRSKWRPRPD